MQNRTLITLLAGTAALGLASLGWTQTSAPMTDSATPAGSTTSTPTATSATTEDSTVGTAVTPSTKTPTNSGQATSADQPMSGTSAAQPMSGTSATGSATAGPATSLAGTDATFLRKAMEGGLEEVKNAQEAMRSAQRAEVRNVASMMLEDHSRSNEKLTQIANRKGWELPAAAEAAESDQPRTVAGGEAGFDDNYLESEIRHHRETISLYRAQASTGTDPDLRQFATEALPSLEHHLEMLQGSHSTK